MAMNQHKVNIITHGLLSRGQDGISDKELEQYYNQATKYDVKQATLGGTLFGGFFGATLGGMAAIAAAGLGGLPAGIVAAIVVGAAAVGSIAGGVLGNIGGKWQREEGLGHVKLQYAAQRGLARGVSQNGLNTLAYGVHAPTVFPNYSQQGLFASHVQPNQGAWQQNVHTQAIQNNQLSR